MKTSSVLLVDCGTGNLRSVATALKELDVVVHQTNKPQDLRTGSKIILPGVGAFKKFMAGLSLTGLDEALIQSAARGDPILGICVGMQSLFETSEEKGIHKGLALIPGQVLLLPNQSGLKIPHTGWNQLWPLKDGTGLYEGLKPGAYVYFNHSYYCKPAISDDTITMTDHGISFSSMINHDNLYGVQFHPEKSQQEGLKILENFLNRC